MCDAIAVGGGWVCVTTVVVDGGCSSMSVLVGLLELLLELLLLLSRGCQSSWV